MLGILGGMGPSATADFLVKLIALTPAQRDQEHIPLIISCLPQTPDRSTAILGGGPSPLPTLLKGLKRLQEAGALSIVIPCNTSHHWFDQLQAATPVPILHIADAALAALPADPRPVAILATRGALASGFYQRKLEARGQCWCQPAAGAEQDAVDHAIAGIKAGDPNGAGAAMATVWQYCADAGVGAAIMACTEIPLAAQHAPPPPFTLVDTNLELARYAVAYALARGWNQPCEIQSATCSLPNEDLCGIWR